MVLVLIEGVDRTGKSTLAGVIADLLRRLHPADRVELLRAGPPVKHPLDEYERPLFHYRPGSGHHIICDRWHIGERVYPLVFDRKTALTNASTSHIEAFLRSRGALLVYLHAAPSVLDARLDAEQRATPGSSLVDSAQLTVSRHLMDVEARASTLVRYEVDTTFDRDMAFDAQNVVRVAETLERNVLQIAELRTYVGSENPHLLLLGNVRHAYRTMKRDPEVAARAAADPTPALMPYPATSGHFLLSAVDPFASRSDFGLLNVNDVDDARRAWEILGEPPAVALGVDAWRSSSEWAAGAVPHPQYVRRFFNKHSRWYADFITRAAGGLNLLGERPAGTWLDGGRNADRERGESDADSPTQRA